MIKSNPSVGRPRKLPGYYFVDTKTWNPSSTPFSVTFDLNQGLNDFASATRSFGKRLKIHHFVFKFDVDFVAVIVNPPVSILFNNILSLLRLKTTTPLIPDYLYQEPTTMDIVHLESFMVSPICYQLTSELDNNSIPKSVIDAYDNSFSSHVAEMNPKVVNPNSNNDPNDTYGFASKFVPIGWGTNDPVIRSYFVCIPCCIYSNPVSRDYVYTDTLPAEIFTSPSGKALFTISLDDNSKPLSSIMGLVVSGTFTQVSNLNIKISLYAYCSFEESDDDFIHGVTWKSASMAMKNTGDSIKPDLYRVGYIGLPQASTYSDGNATMLQSRPFDFASLSVNPFSDKAYINWIIDGNNVWPSSERNYAYELVRDWNLGFRTNSNNRLMLNYSSNQSNLFISPSSSLTGNKNSIITGVAGYLSYAPFFPLFFSHPGRKGFAPGFLQIPGEDVSIQVQLSKWTITDAMASRFRAITMSGSENWSKQRDTIRRFCINGASNDNKGIGTWHPLLDRGGSIRDKLFSIVVPEYCKASI